MPDVGMNTAKGALGGAVAGAALGSFLGPVGMGVGAIVGGIFGGKAGKSKTDAYNNAMDRVEGIPLVDPMQLGFKDQVAREKRMVESGFTTDFQVAKDILKSTNAGAMSVASKVGAGNPALALTMMKEANRNMDVGLNKALGTISTRSSGYTQMMSDMVDKISQRKLDLTMYKTNVELAQAGKEYKDFVSNSNAQLARLPSVGTDFMNQLGSVKAGTTNVFGQPKK